MPNGNKMQEYAKNLADTEAASIKAVIGAMHDELVTQKEKQYIPEIVFKETFLGFFKTMSAEGIDDTLAKKWVDFAGSPYNEVDVIDKTGNVMYTVPGLLSRPNVDKALGKNVNFDKMVTTYELKRNRLPEVGDRYLAAELDNIPNSITANVAEDALRWKQIFDRYSGDNNMSVTPFAQAKKQIPSANPNDDVLTVIY